MTAPARRLPFCVYCGDAAGREAEHVFPKGWYPDTTPRTLQRLTVPACRACNERFKRVEEVVGPELLMGMADLNRPEVAGVNARVSKSWRADLATTLKEQKHRMRKAERIWRTMQWQDPAPGAPQVQLRSSCGLIFRASPSRALDGTLLNMLAEKFVRGLHYAETGLVVGALEVRATRVHDRGPKPNAAEWAPFFKALDVLPIDQRLGPGLWYRRYHGAEISGWAFLLWGEVEISALAKGLSGVFFPHASAGGGC